MSEAYDLAALPTALRLLFNNVDHKVITQSLVDAIGHERAREVLWDIADTLNIGIVCAIDEEWITDSLDEDEEFVGTDQDMRDGILGLCENAPYGVGDAMADMRYDLLDKWRKDGLIKEVAT